MIHFYIFLNGFNISQHSCNIVFGLSEIDDELEKDEVSFVKISEEGSEEQFGILELPALAFIQNGIPNIYDGDLVIEKSY